MKRNRLAVAAVVLALAAGLLTGCDHGATVLSGTLSFAGGGPVPKGITVAAFGDASDSVVAMTTTGSSGAFTFGENDLAPGDYRIRFGDGSWWQDASGWSSATAVTASKASPPTIDAEIVPPSGTVEGTVTRRSGRPVEGATVNLVDSRSGGVVTSTTTAADGTYAFTGLSARSVIVEVSDSTYATWYSGGAASSAGATPIEIDGSSRVDVDVTLAPRGTLSGSVGGVGTDRSGFGVLVVDRASGQPIRYATTGATGAFTFDDLPAGSYGVTVLDSSGRFHDRAAGSTTADLTAGATYVLAENQARSVGAVTLVGGACPTPSTQVDLTGVHLAGTNLANCDLTGSTLNGADLSGADLSGAVLSLAQVRDANLAGANLADTRLINTSLTRSNLAGAHLDRALAMNTDFGGATLTGATMSGLTLNAANLGATDFGGTAPGSARSTNLVGTPVGLPAGWSMTAGCLVGPGASLAFQNFAGADFSGRDLVGVNLQGSNLTGASLAGADLAMANLRDTKLAGANLTGTKLPSASLTGAFSGGLVGVPSVLPAGWVLAGGALFGPSATVSGVDITAADLSGADLTRITARSLVGTPSALPTGWVLAHGTLVGVAATITGADITGVDLSGVDPKSITSGGLTGTPSALPAGTVLHNGYLVGPGANLNRAQLAGLVAPGIDLSGVDLQYADLSGADLNGADLNRAHLDYTDLSGADLSHADLTKVAMRGADLTGTVLGTATITGVVSGLNVGTPASLPADRPMIGGFIMNPGAQLVSADVSGLDLSGVDLSGSMLQYANLTGTNLTGANLANTYLNGATLQGTNVTGVDLTGAIFDGATSAGLIGSPAALSPGWIVRDGVLVPPNG